MKKLSRALEFPTTRRDPDSGYTLHGRRFDDPYAWLERLDDPETQAWLAAQEAVTRSVLSAVPGRDWLRAEVARSRRCARLSPPIAAGANGLEFLWQADASEEKLKFMLRRGKDAPLETVVDPTRGRATRSWCSPCRRPTARWSRSEKLWAAPAPTPR